MARNKYDGDGLQRRDRQGEDDRVREGLSGLIRLDPAVAEQEGRMRACRL